MERRTPFYAYKETRLDLEPSIPGSTIAIRLPTHGSTSWPLRANQKRAHIVELPVAEDEDVFKHRYLAIAASVYHRLHHKSPRSFLWRILENGKILSIRVVDISKPRNSADFYLTLRLTFPNQIVPAGVAFADSEEHDVLSVFVLTESNHLYTLTLRPDFFRRSTSTEGNVGDWCKSYLSSAFSFKHPHRLVALNADELLVSLIDGGLLRLNRKSGGDGFEWKEVFYNEGGWSHSLRSLIPFQTSNTVHYGKHNIELSAVTSISSPIVNIDGYPYAFTVSLDHRLRVWNLDTGKIAHMSDMLNHDLDPNETVKKVIDPSLSQLVKVFGSEDPLCVTYSPLGIGEFKFWNVASRVDGTLELTDLFPKNFLRPRAPTSDLWTVADFSVVLDQETLNKYTIWTLWKNNTTYRVQSLKFQSGNIGRVDEAWKNGWEAMATETLRETPTPTLFSGDPVDITDKWLEFILTPGRFTKATIETGLAICESNSGSSKATAQKPGSLPERLCLVLASNNTLGRASDGNMDYEQLRTAVESQWLRFYRLLSELDKLRGEAQSLVIDPKGNMPWVILADGITVVRECSDLERIWHNPEMLPAGTEHVAAPIIAASEFRDAFSPQLLYSCKTTLLGEMFEEPSATDPSRMRSMYDRCDFSNQIGDEDYTQLAEKLEKLGGGFKDVTPEVYGAVLDLMAAPKSILKRKLKNELAEFGNKMIVKGTQETVELHRNICLDQIVLLVLIEAEINHSDDGIQFETAAYFQQFLAMLKRLELINWLASSQISLPFNEPERVDSVAEKTQKKQAPGLATVSVLEKVFGHLWCLDLRPSETMPSAVTEHILETCDDRYEATSASTQCLLLVNERQDLAMDFNRFADRDPFSTYIQGRVNLASNNMRSAAVLFKRAAFGLSYKGSKKRNYHNVSYLDDIELNSFDAGLPAYYAHIVALYEKERAFSFVIEFSRLALQFTKTDSGHLEEQLRTEMQNRLFNAALQTSRFELAYSALSLITIPPLKRSSLQTLIIKLCESSHASELIELPFIGLQDEVDEILAHKCHNIVDVTVGVPYHKILYAWRIKRGDFRGAAAISLERLQRLQQAGEGDRKTDGDGLETPVTQQYMALINVLSCVEPKQAWILFEEPSRKRPASRNGNGEQGKRKVVTLDEIRKEYQAELDRIAAIENDQFAFTEGGEMDVL